MSYDPLQQYRSRRRTQTTPEPDASAHRTSSDKPPVFVIQKHDASSLHYDFRLEIDGVLKSWAIPKGPSTDPRDKRLAVETEDHPLAYVDFEGVIPDTEYGGGTVLVWDIGVFDNAKRDEDDQPAKPLADCWADGHLTITLHGQKLTGGYALTYFRNEGNQRQWLLVKVHDIEADARRNPVNAQVRSVLSDRTTAEIDRREGRSDD